MKTKSHFQIKFLKTCISIILLLLINANSHSQNNLITIRLENVPLADILQEIKVPCGKNLLYKNDLVERYTRLSVQLSNTSLTDALTETLKSTELQWQIVEGTIIIEPRDPESEQLREPYPLTQTIRGRMVDLNSGAPLTGANIILSGSSPIKGTVSDPAGYYQLEEVPLRRQTVEASFIGYHSSVFKNLYVISGKEFILDIKLEERVIQGKEVTVKAFS